MVLVLVLSACGFLQKEKPQIVTKTVMVAAPANMYCAQTMPLPVDPVLYADSSFDSKEKMLFDLIIMHQVMSGACLTKNRILKEWSDDQVRIHNR